MYGIWNKIMAAAAKEAELKSKRHIINREKALKYAEEVQEILKKAINDGLELSGQTKDDFFRVFLDDVEILQLRGF